MNEPTYKIVSLRVNNFKNIKAVQITPEGNVVTLAGDNGAGKSAILDAIEEVFIGKGSATQKPIREGAENAETVVNIGHGLVAKRRYTPSGSTLRIESEDGSKQSPQALMDTLTTCLAFDPITFTTRKPSEQREILLDLLGLDFTDSDAKAKRAYDERTIENRKVDTISAQIATLPESPAGVSTVEAISMAEQSATEVLRERLKTPTATTIPTGRRAGSSMRPPMLFRRRIFL